MKKVLFYSWMTGRSEATNRALIRRALEEACKRLEASGFEVSIDEATRDEAGSPDIVSTILRKIRSADLFVGDVTLLDNAAPGRHATPNPNVLIEVGYGLGKLGRKRIVLVQNEIYGGPEHLPFDIRSRAIVTYQASEESTKLKDAERDLAGLLARKLGLSLELGAEQFLDELAEITVGIQIAIDEDAKRTSSAQPQFVAWADALHRAATSEHSRRFDLRSSLTLLAVTCDEIASCQIGFQMYPLLQKAWKQTDPLYEIAIARRPLARERARRLLMATIRELEHDAERGEAMVNVRRIRDFLELMSKHGAAVLRLSWLRIDGLNEEVLREFREAARRLHLFDEFLIETAMSLEDIVGPPRQCLEVFRRTAQALEANTG